MKKILLAILLILSLSLTLVACVGNGGGELSTGEQGTKEDGGNWNSPSATLAPGETFVPGEEETTPSNGSQIENAGANTEGGWSPVHGPNSRK